MTAANARIGRLDASAAVSPPRGVLVAVRVVYGALALIVLVGLVIQLALILTGGADANSGEVDTTQHVGTRLVRLFSFFTIQSNLFVLAVAATLVIRPLRRGGTFDVIRLDSLLGIAITGLVFATILAPLVKLTGWAFVATVCFHYLSPWLALLAWFVFGPRPTFTWGGVLAAFIWPTAWLLYTFIRGAIVHWYPYPFLNVDEIGLAAAVRNSLIVVAVAVVFALILKLVDRYLPDLLPSDIRRRNGKSGSGPHAA